MNTTRLQQARRLFFHDLVDPRTARHNARQWVRSLRALGDRWLLAQPIETKRRRRVRS